MITYAFELTAHEEHTGPNASPYLLTRCTVEVTLAIAKQDFRQSPEASIFSFVNLFHPR